MASVRCGSKRGTVAERPGYARMDLVTATLYWQFIDAQGWLQKLDRREAANFFLDIKVPDYDDDLLRDEPLE